MPRRIRTLSDRPVVVFLFVAAIYFLLARAAYNFVISPAAVAAWPPAGFLLAALLLIDRRRWWLVALGGLVGNAAADLLQRAPPVVALAGGAVNALESVVAAFVVRRLAGSGTVTLTRLREVVALFLGGAVFSNALTAFLGATLLSVGYSFEFWRGWFVWWAGDGIGMLVIAPAILACAGEVLSPAVRRRSRVEAVLYALVFGTTAAVLVSRDSLGPISTDVYMIIPLLFWAAVRLGPSATALSALWVAGWVVFRASGHGGAFGAAGISVEDQVLRIHTYLGLVSLSGMVPAAILRQREVAEARLLDRAQHAALVADVATALTSTAPLADVLLECAAAMRRGLGASHARIWIMDDSGQALTLVASTGAYSPAHKRQASVRLNETKIGVIAASGRPLLSNDIRTDPRVLDRDWIEREGLVGFAGCPLALENRVVGVAALYSREKFSERAIEALEAVSRHLALGIERKRVEQSLNVTEERLRFALGAAGVGVWEASFPEGHVYWSDECQRMHGCEPGTFAGTMEAVLDRVRPDYRDRVARKIVSASARGTVPELEFPVTWPDGSEHWILSKGRMTLDREGRPSRAAGVAIDLTERRSLERQLRQSQKLEALGRLAAGVAHDFNNVITAILIYAEALAETATASQREAVVEIANAGRRASSLTRQLLVFGRRGEDTPEVVDVAAIVASFLPMLRRLVGEQIHLTTDFTPAPKVLADVTALEQIILNLSVNAADAMPGGGGITIRVCPRGEFTMLEFTDTGIGIDEATQARIFEPFFTTKASGKGTGLGLSTVAAIVAAMHGTIDVTSQVGVGTTFRVSLPQHVSPEPDQVSRPAAADVSGGSETILVVEDEPPLQLLVRRLLEQRGYTVRLADSKAAALATVAREGRAIRLVLTDVRLPDGTGVELVRAIRAGGHRMPVVFTSGYGNLDLLEPIEFSQTERFIAKPFIGKELLRLIRESLDAGAD